ncbi:hypothetical protein RRG08_012888 [Elysia crispata]|uniref:Uncharacterized protein n=1 Tax=Elysia crispata TaxID=231223 RepID=A0AAE1AUT8_9GAST|nr:hypothetical protein RRG08_012888 [Elysia crispata]
MFLPLPANKKYPVTCRSPGLVDPGRDNHARRLKSAVRGAVGVERRKSTRPKSPNLGWADPGSPVKDFSTEDTDQDSTTAVTRHRGKIILAFLYTVFEKLKRRRKQTVIFGLRSEVSHECR